MKKASQCALGSADGQLSSCMEWAVHVWYANVAGRSVTDSQRRLRCAGDLSKITGTRLVISPDRQLCWLWRSLLAGRARKAAAQAWMWRQWRPDVTLFPHGAPA